MMLDVERSLISIKHRLQHHPTFVLFLSVNKNVAFIWPPCSTLLNTRMSAKLTLRVSVSMAKIHCLYLLCVLPHALESFQSLPEDSASDLSANRKRKGSSY